MYRYLTLKALIPQNGQTHSNNSSTKADELFECVWPFCKVGCWRVNAVSLDDHFRKAIHQDHSRIDYLFYNVCNCWNGRHPHICDSVFKNGPSKICGKQPSKKLKRYGLFKQTISHQIFLKLYSTNFSWSIVEYIVQYVE